jgi:metallo-beta-lactamase family protein
MQVPEKKLKLTFCGGTGSVTGANFLIEDDVTKILIDCGLEQGGKQADESNRRNFIYDPADIDILLITHGHIDHVGRIPKLVKDGFKGVIYSTPETKEISRLMLGDSVRLLGQEAVREGILPLYEEEDVENSFKNWKTIPYHTPTEIAPGFMVFLKDAGHVLGSTMYEISYGEGDWKKRKKVLFTGDLGNSPNPLLHDTETITDADYIIMESVYGDRNHEPSSERREKLEHVIEETVKKGGTLVIPSFSLEKTQVILYELNRLIDQGRIPVIPVYVDSPLAIKITEIYERASKSLDFNDATRAVIKKGVDIFKFPKLHMTATSDESKAILEVPAPKIVIAGSGMSNGGRVLHHELNYLPHPQNTLLLVGYQAVGTIGRIIRDGAKSINLYGKEVDIKAKVEMIDGYSSHKDSDHLVEFVENDIDTLKKCFVVMGEPKSSLFLVQKLRDNLGIEAYAPEEGSSVELDF